MADEQFPAAVTALEEYHNIEQQMAEPEVASNPDKMRKLGRRHAELGAIVSAYTAYKQVKDDLEAAREMASEDPDFAEEAKRLEGELPAAEEKLRTALIPRDPDDARDTIMEIKAGTGGEEAALFAGDLLRMYMRYAEKRGWSVTVQSENTTELGGVRTCSWPSAPKALRRRRTACGLPSSTKAACTACSASPSPNRRDVSRLPPPA